MDDMIGKVIDNYKILEVLGQGGMGTVYKAVDETLEKEVALKMLEPRLVKKATLLKRFMAEPKLQAKLESPHIVRVFAFRKTQLGLFIVMEYVEGETLADIIKKSGTVPWQKALVLFKQILAALGHAHSVGIIHRDIKPRNVLVTPVGQAKVTDFGLAKFQEGGDATLTQTLAGTVKYMPPEQVEGLKNVDHRGDIYAAGVSLYEMLAGRVPFQSAAGDYALLRAIVEDPAPPPTRFNPNIPKGLNDIVMKMMEKDVRKRYQSAAEVLNDLERFEDFMRRGGEEPTLGQTDTMSATVTDSTIVAPNSPTRHSFTTTPTQTIDPNIPNFLDEAVEELEGSRYSTTLNNAPLDTTSLRSAPIGKIMVGALLGLGLLAALVYFVIMPMLLGPVTYATLDFTSTPASAAILVDGVEVGKTPLQYKVTAKDAHSIRVQLDGYQTWSKDEAVFDADKNYPFVIDLKVAKNVGTVSIMSNPSRAKVFLGEMEIGTTPIDSQNVEAGEYELRLVKSGYQTYTEKIVVDPRGLTPITATMKRSKSSGSGRTPAAAANAVLILKAVPSGSISIDGRVKQSTSNATLRTRAAAGNRKILFRHPEYGAKEVTLNAKTSGENRLTCYFESYLSINSVDENGDLRWGNIYINGRNIDQTTPRSELPLGVGTYRITVKRSGHETVEGEKTITVRPDTKKVVHRLKFTLRKIQ